MLSEALKTFEVNDEDLPLSFIKRLALENGWSLDFARAAFNEYRRFIALCVQDQGLTVPSDIIDEVWHLHLCYTKSYWQDLCTDILGRPLHHCPTVGGGGQDRLYAAGYAQTLSRYRSTFGHQPPPAFWPPSEKRFRPLNDLRKVRKSEHLIFPKRPIYAALAIGVSSLLLVGCGVGGGAQIMALAFALAVVLFIFLSLRDQKESKPKRKRGDKSGCGHAGASGCGVGGRSDGCGGDSGGGCSGGGCGGGGCGGG